MRVLITGATGFTGRHFIQAATAAGHETVPLTADLTEPEAVEQEVMSLRPEAAVHLAAISFVGHADERAFYDVNLFGTLHLLDALKKCGGLQKVLLASSANVYGNCEQSPISESQVPAPVNHYAASKLAMEHLARARAQDLPLVITRPFNYTGIGQGGQFVIPKLVDHFRRRSATVRLGNLQVEREYNDVRFVCDAYLALLDASVPCDVYNICTGKTYNFDDVLALLQDLTGHRIRVEFDPVLARRNEVARLAGDPSKLNSVYACASGYSLSDTLRWMLDAAE